MTITFSINGVGIGDWQVPYIDSYSTARSFDLGYKFDPISALNGGYALEMKVAIMAYPGSGALRLDYELPLEITLTGTGTVPEPASWAMLVTGFGLTGAAMRRRRTPLAA